MSTDQQQAESLASIAESLASLAALAKRLEPLLIRFEESLAAEDAEYGDSPAVRAIGGNTH